MYVHIEGSSFCTMLNPAMFQDNQFADVTFICGDKLKVKAHRLIIGSVSSLLKDCLAQADAFEIVLPDFSSTDVDNLLRFIYEGLVRLQGEEILQFKSLFQLLKLKIPVHIASEQGDNANEQVWASGGVNSERKETATKRKASSPLSCPSSSKALKMSEKDKCDPAIQGLNNSIAKLSVPSNMEGSSPICKPLPKPIPLKYFKDFVCRVEKNKAEKNLKKMVEEAVQKQLRKEKEDIEKITKTVKLELEKRDAEILELKENMKQANSQSCKKALIRKSTSILPEEKSSKALTLINENVVISNSPSSLSTSPNLLAALKKKKVSMSTSISGATMPEKIQVVSSKCSPSSSNSTTNLVAREQKINQVVNSKCPPSSLSTATSNTEAKQQKINQVVSSKYPPSSLSTSLNFLAAQNNKFSSATISGAVLPKNNQLANPSYSAKSLPTSKTPSSTFVSTIQPSKQLNQQSSTVAMNKASVKLASSFNIKNHASKESSVAMASAEESPVKEAYMINNIKTKRVFDCKPRIPSDKSSPEEIKRIMKIIETAKKQHDAKTPSSSKLPSPNQKMAGKILLVSSADQTRCNNVSSAPKLNHQSTSIKASKAHDGHYPENVRTVVSLSNDKGIAPLPTTAIARSTITQIGDPQDPKFNPVGASNAQVHPKHMQPQKAKQSVQQPPSASAGSALPSSYGTLKVVTLTNGTKVTVIARPSV